MMSHHSAKYGAHWHLGSADIIFLVVKEKDSTCLLISAITISKAHDIKAHGIPY